MPQRRLLDGLVRRTGDAEPWHRVEGRRCGRPPTAATMHLRPAAVPRSTARPASNPSCPREVRVDDRQCIGLGPLRGPRLDLGHVPWRRRRTAWGCIPSRRSIACDGLPAGGVAVHDQNRRPASAVASSGVSAAGGWSGTPSRAVKWNDAPLALARSRPRSGPPSSRRAGARSPGRGPCRRTGGSSSRRPARTARRSVRVFSGAMPMPVSATLTRSTTSSPGWAVGARRERRPRPTSVNLIALPTRLTRIWRSRPGSP